MFMHRKAHPVYITGQAQYNLSVMMKSLSELKKIKIAKPEQKQSSSKKKSRPEEQQVQTEEDLFLRAMNGVRPISGKGRELTPGKHHQSVEPLDEEQEGINFLNRLVRGEIEFNVQYSDEYIQGCVQGLNNRVFRRLKAGRISTQAHLDLHGQNALQAKSMLLSFMRLQYVNSRKCVLIITGRGKNSPLGAPVLRNEIQGWLTREPLKRIVLAFCSAQPRHGGTGALHVLMRDHKKTRGKINWKRYIFDEDDE